MRDGWSNDKKTRHRGAQNEYIKVSMTWLHDFPLRQEQRKAPQKLGFDCWKKIIQKRGWIAISFVRGCSAQGCLYGLRLTPMKSAGEALAEFSRSHSSHLISLFLFQCLI